MSPSLAGPPKIERATVSHNQALPHYAQKIYYAILQCSLMLPIMLLILTHYSTLCFIKDLMKFIIQHKIHAFKVHSSSSQPFSTTVQQNYQGCNTVSTVRESESPPLQPLVPLLLGKSLISPLVAIFFSASTIHGLGVKGHVSHDLS